MQKSPFNSVELSDTYVKAKTTKFFGFVTENRKYNDFFFNWQSKSSLHCFNVNYGKKLKRWSDEVFNASKEIEVMKRLTLHCFIASSLLLPSFAIEEVEDNLRFLEAHCGASKVEGLLQVVDWRITHSFRRPTVVPRMSEAHFVVD